MKNNSNGHIKTKFNLKIFAKLLSIILIFLVCGYALIFGFGKAKEFLIYSKPSPETKIYTIWHVETFEGGAKSRINYLTNIARKMEKENPALLFHIQKIEPNQLADNLADSVPDIISFGQGVGKEILEHLIEFKTTYNVQDKYVQAGSFNNKIYALPYIASGYAMFSHGEIENSIEYGNSGYINPQKAISASEKPIKQFGTQFETYKNFVYHHDHALLGSARDVFRIDNLNKIGRTNASITPIDTYTDLIQYLGKTKTDSIIETFCTKVFEPSNQQKLVDYSLFSTINTKIYVDGIYNDMENAIFKCKVQPCFDY